MRNTIFKRRSSAVKPGMTLVELLVVTSIILIVVVMSVPIFKPMLESRKQADGAQRLSIYLNVARIRASETGLPCGVMFERYTDNNYRDGDDTIYPYNDTCLIVRQVEVPPPYGGSVENIRVSLDMNGAINFYNWGILSGTNPVQYGWVLTSDEDGFWNAMVERGDKIQFDGQGPYHELTSVRSTNGSGPQISTNGPRFRVYTSFAPVPFKVLRSPKPTLAAPIDFPLGIVVDLEYSGIDNGLIATSPDVNYPGFPLIRGSDFHPATPDIQEPVIVMFSPSGGVDHIHSHVNVYNNNNVLVGTNYNNWIPTGPIHFLVGKWERAGNYWEKDSNDVWNRDNYPATIEDGLRNYQDISNLWVTIHPQTGMVSTNPVAYYGSDSTKSWLRNSRNFAERLQITTSGR